MSVFRNVMVYLGLGADDEYDDDYLADEGPVNEASVGADSSRGPVAASPSMSVRGPTNGSFGNNPATGERPSAVGAVRPLRSVPVPDENDEPAEAQTGTAVSTPRIDDSRVRAVPMQRSKPRALAPQSFGDAKTMADELRKSVPVIMNLRGLDRDLARRLIDFASGSCYSLGGKMEKLAPQVFLLIPKAVEVSDDDRRRIEERGFDRD